jgi:hypothetical protein
MLGILIVDRLEIVASLKFAILCLFEKFLPLTMQGLVSCLWALIGSNYAGHLLLFKALIQVLNLNDQLIGTGSTLSPGAATDLNLL